MVGCALARAHARLGRLGRDDLVGEDANPHFTATLEVVRNGAPSGLDLAGGNPRRLERADSELTEGDGVAAGCDTTQAAVGALVHLAMLESFRLRHQGAFGRPG